MNLRASQPDPVGRSRVLVDREDLVEYVRVYEECKAEVQKALTRLESGRADSAATVLRRLKRRLG